MTSLRKFAAATALVLLAGGCARTEAGTAAPLGGAVTPGGSVISPDPGTASGSATAVAPATTAPGPGGGVGGAAGGALAVTITNGMAQVTSLTGTMDIQAQGISSDITFVQQMANSKVTAMDLQMSLTGMGQAQVLFVEDRLFLAGDMVASLGGDKSKKYLELTATTSNAGLAPLYTQFRQTVDQTSTTQYTDLLSVVSSIDDEGQDEVDGQPAHKYSAVVDLALLEGSDLPESSKESMQTLATAGVTELPMEFWLDDQDRMIKVIQKVTAMGQDITTTITMGGFNEPVDISLPPESEIGQG